MSRREKPFEEVKSDGTLRSRKSRKRHRELMQQIKQEIDKLAAARRACSPVEELRAALTGVQGPSTRAREALTEVLSMLKAKPLKLEKILRRLRD
jgi:hypothetical protein